MRLSVSGAAPHIRQKGVGIMIGMGRGMKLFSRWSERIRTSQDQPPADDAQPGSVLITQDSVEQCTLVAQSLFDAGALSAGQAVTVEGHRVMRVTIEQGRVVLVTGPPLEETVGSESP